MMQKIFCFAVLISISCSVAVGQYPYGPNVSYNRASTIGESHARGMADLVRSSGAANLMNSAAAINVEQARSAELDNRLKYAQTYYDKRRMREEAKDYDKIPMTQEKAYRMAALQKPKAMGPSDIDSSTGKIHWPLAIMQPSMSESRELVDQLMGEASVAGSLSADSYFEIVKLCETLDDQLNAALRSESMPMQEISQGKAFLKKIAYAAKQAAT